MARRSKTPTYNFRERLELFLFRVQKLENTRLGKSQKQIPIQLSAAFVPTNNGLNIKVNLNQPNEDELLAYLVHFRPFILENDPVHLYGIYNLILRYINDVTLKAEIKAWRDVWAQWQKDDGDLVEIKGKKYSHSQAADFWINGQIFHTDPENVGVTKSLSLMEYGYLRVRLVQYLNMGNHHVTFLRDVIKEILEKNLYSDEAFTVMGDV